MMKKKVKIVLASILIIIFALLYSFVNKITPIYNTDWDTSEYESVELYDGDSITQSFTCEKSHLDGISLKITSIEATDQLLLDYQLRDEETGSVLRDGRTNLNSLESGKFFEIDFERINDCQGKTFIFDLTISNGGEDNGICVYTTDLIKSSTSLEKDGSMLNSTLVLRMLTYQFDFETFFVVICFALYIVFFMKWMYKLFK